MSIFRVVGTRWPHVAGALGDYYVVKLHSLIQVHSLVILINFMHLINPQNMEHIKMYIALLKHSCVAFCTYCSVAITVAVYSKEPDRYRGLDRRESSSSPQSW